MEGENKVSLHRFLADQKLRLRVRRRRKKKRRKKKKKKSVLGHPKARATSYCLFPDTLCLRASKNAFNVGSIKFADSLSPPSIVKKIRTGSKSSQGT